MPVSGLSLLWAALRRRPFSFMVTVLLCGLSASLMGIGAPMTLLAWLMGGAALLTLWSLVEPRVLRLAGCRQPGSTEELALAAALRASAADVLIADDDVPWVGSGVRTLVISRALLDVVDGQPLAGLVAHAVARKTAACLTREILVWLGNAPLVAAWLTARWLSRVGTLLAFAVGGALVFPLLLWPHSFVTWGGRLFGWIAVGLLGAVLLSGGLAGPGLGLLVGWAFVAGLRALLAWESRGVEAELDRAIVEAGLGPQLREGLETIAWLNAPRPDGWHAWLVRSGSPLAERIERIAAWLAIG